MKIYLLVNWDNDDYARFSHIGTWKEVREPCNECNINTETLVEPLQIEWEPGSDLIGDFSWCGYSIIVLEKVREFMLKNNFDCHFGKVAVYSPKTPLRRRRIVPFPYDGPTLYWLLPNNHINLDIKKSGLTIKSDCNKCKRKIYKFKMGGIVIPKSEWHNQKIFRINQFGLSSVTYVTEKALENTISQQFSNFWYKEAGYIEE